MLRQTEPEKLVSDLVTALKALVERVYLQRIKLPMAETVLRSAAVWRWCLALQPPILFNKRRLSDIVCRVMALIDDVSGVSEKNGGTSAVSTTPLSSQSASTTPPSPIKFIITGNGGDGKSLALAVMSLFLQDQMKQAKMSSSIIIPVFPTASSVYPHACNVLKAINNQLRERLPNSLRRVEPPHSSLRSLTQDFSYYTTTLLSLSHDAVIVVIIDDVHLLSHSVACVEQPAYGYFLPLELNSRVVTIVSCDPSHVPWLQSQSLAPPSSCVMALKDASGGGDCRVGIISTFAARHLKPCREAEMAIQAMTSSQVVRDIHHFRSVFAAAADDHAQFHALFERALSIMPFDLQKTVKRIHESASFQKWFGTENDLPNRDSDHVLFFSHSSILHARGSCAALESLTPPNDFGTVTIVKMMLDAGLADVCLVSSVSRSNCVFAVLDAASQAIGEYIVARIAALVSCAHLSLRDLGDILTLDGGAVNELDANVTAYSIKQFPLRVVDDVLVYLAIVGVKCLMDDSGGVFVAPHHTKALLLQWSISHGFSELDAHTAIGVFVF